MKFRQYHQITIYSTAIIFSFILANLLFSYKNTTDNLSTTNQPVSQYYDQQSILQEFINSYPETVKSTNNTVTVKLTAAQSTINLNDHETQTWTYNQQVPGPTIKIKLGDTLKVTLNNQLPQPTTIHWHGIRISNPMDGVPDVTQKPIQPGENFTYEFTPKDVGTFWYHPHVRGSEQLERGLYGVLIVENPTEPAYSQDVTWVLDDWRLNQTGEISSSFNTPHDLMHDGRWGNLITVNGSTDEKLQVRPGERIRLRLVNTSNARVYRPNFDRLPATVIAVDGMLVSQPFPLNNFDLAPGNRLDLDITIPPELSGKQIPVLDYYTRQNIPLATLNINPVAPVSPPNFKFPQATHFPNWENLATVPVFHEYTLNATRGRMMAINWTIDNQIYPNVKPTTLETNKFYKIKFTNQSYRLHPMHLHGQFFKLLTRNSKPVNESFWRDTVLVTSQETIEIGLVPTEKGTWANHCHIQEHAEAGMMTLVKVI